MGQQFNLRAMTITSTGTGPLTLGTAIAPFKAFNAAPAVATGTFLSYRIDHGSDWELSEGFYNAAAGTLGRQLVESSTGSLLNITGSAKVAIVPHARDFAPNSNYSATSAPSSANDQSQGYVVGSEWLWAARGLLWKCTSAATGAAVWALIPTTSTSGMSTDLIEGNGPWGIWKTDHSGGGSDSTVNMAGVSGGRRLSVATSGQRALISTNNNDNNGIRPQAGAIHLCLGRFVIEHTPTSTEDFIFSFGAQAFWSDPGANMASIAWRWSGSAPQLVFRTRAGFGSITTTVLANPAINTPIELGVLVNGSGSASAILDGVVAATHTTNLPLDDGTNFGSPWILKNNGSATVSVVVDRLRIDTWRQ